MAMVVLVVLVAMMAHDYQASLEEINNYIIIVAPLLLLCLHGQRNGLRNANQQKYGKKKKTITTKT